VSVRRPGPKDTDHHCWSSLLAEAERERLWSRAAAALFSALFSLLKLRSRLRDRLRDADLERLRDDERERLNETQRRLLPLLPGNERMPKIVINNTINLLSKTALSILVISNHNSFRELFDKTASMLYLKNLFIF